MSNLKEAISIACKYESLPKALAYMASWEVEKASTRSIKEPNFEYVFALLLKEYEEYKRSEMADTLKNIIKYINYVDAIAISKSSKEYYLFVKEHGSFNNDDWNKLIDFETKYDTYVHVRAYQNRILNDSLFIGLEKIWVRESY